MQMKSQTAETCILFFSFRQEASLVCTDKMHQSTMRTDETSWLKDTEFLQLTPKTDVYQQIHSYLVHTK